MNNLEDNSLAGRHTIYRIEAAQIIGKQKKKSQYTRNPKPYTETM